MRFTSCIPALGMLTFQLVSLSKPVGPFNEIGTPWRTVIEPVCRQAGIFYSHDFFQ